MYIDTHCHLSLEDYDDIDLVIKENRENNISIKIPYMWKKELIEKLGEDKYQQLTNSLDKYIVDGDRAGLREANTIIDRADRSVGGMNRNERFDRRDLELLLQSEYEYFFQSLHFFSSFPAPAIARILPNPIRFPLYMISEL